MALDTELAREQAHVDRAYTRLAQLRAAARRRTAEAAANPGGTHQAKHDRDAMVRTGLRRAAALEIGEEALIFGRIDRADGEQFHIGRVAVADTDREPLVVDWRAPAAAAFYRATSASPEGLVRRRTMQADGQTLIALDDEVFDTAAAAERELVLAGEAALLAAVGRSRTEHMRDIVATLQAEQDEIVRAPLEGVLVVQGGPGTGKTAVALHRAAYLLYTHRSRMEADGVLLVGPSRRFLRYIQQVLPALGEDSVRLATIVSLTGVKPQVIDSTAVQRLKGDPRMARVLAAAVRQRQRPLPDALPFSYGGRWVRLEPGDTKQVLTQVRRGSGTHNARQADVRRGVLQVLFRKYCRSAGRRADPTLWTEFAGAAGEDHRIDEAVDLIWPKLRPDRVLATLLGKPGILARAARGVLTDDEIAEFAATAPSASERRWSPADAILLDEIAALIGWKRSQPTFGHVIIDEAQDLSPMAWRLLARRCPDQSMTIVGDLAQATGAWRPTSWQQATARLRLRRPLRLSYLTIGYRTPSEVMAVAAPVLRQVAPNLSPPRSVRATGVQPEILRVAVDELAVVLCARARGELAQVAPGTVAVLVASDGDPVLTRDLPEAVSLLSAVAAKGLEFDSVIVVEPTAIVGEHPAGAAALYIALTRPTQRLTVLHSQPLPTWFTPGDDGA